jgi:RHS repeat-associated protein
MHTFTSLSNRLHSFNLLSSYKPRIYPLLALGIWMLSWLLTPAVYGQSCADEQILNQYQPTANAAIVRIQAGFSITTQLFTGQACAGPVVPPEVACPLTVSDGSRIQLGQMVPLTAAFSCNLAATAYNFDGVNDYIAMPAVVNAALADNFTWEGWVNVDPASNTITVPAQTTGGIAGTSGQKYLVFPTHGASWGTGHAGMGISIGTNGIAVFEHDAGYLAPLLSHATSFSGWTHIAVVYSAKKPILYINGAKIKEGLVSTKIVHPTLGMGGGAYGYFKGQADEVRLWNTARTDAEISANYQRVLARTTAGLVGNWHANEQFGLTATDVSSSNYFGTLYNGVTRINSAAPVANVFTWSVSPSGIQSGLVGTPTGNRVEVTPTAANTYVYSVSVVDAKGNVQVKTISVLVDPAGTNLAVKPGTEMDNRNYVVENTVAKPGVTSEAALSMPVGDLLQTITYTDGAGKTEQTVGTQASPTRMDLVQPIQYDGLGRESIKKLAYTATGTNGHFRTNASGEQKVFYQSNKNDDFALSETQYELSPLSRPIKQGGVGTDWQISTGRITEASWRTNQLQEIRRWVYDPATGKADGRGFYDNNATSGELSVTETTDKTGPNPGGFKVLEFKDYQGRVVCKKVQQSAATPAIDADWQTTYYVYDEYGQLRYLLPPSAVKQIGETGKVATVWVLDPATDTDFLTKLVFAYQYDNKGRLAEKRVPSAEPSYYVYNRYDQLVLTQQGRQREAYTSDGTTYAAGQWNYTKYDEFGRVITTGLYLHGAVVSQSSMQGLVDAQSVLFETRSVAAGSVQGYTNTAFPTANIVPLTVSYYDDYNYPGALAFVTGPCSSNASYFTRLRGQQTGAKVKLLDSDQWLTTTTYYDQDGNVVEALTENHLRISTGSPNGKDIVFNCYDWSGKLLSSELRHENPLATGQKNRIVRTRTVYDHTGTIKETYQQVDNGVEERIGAYSYNALGEMTSKQIGRGLQLGTALQTVDYKYNIKGWLTSINGGLSLNTTQNDKFGLELSYTTAPGSGPTTTARYDGNIIAQRWISGFDNAKRGYNYTYDPISRLTSAAYSAKDAADNDISGEDYSLPSVSYDINGNIKTLQRKGISSASGQPVTYGLVDDLQYKLKADNQAVEGNRLINVRDLTVTTSAQTVPGVARDFMEGNIDPATIEYAYDKSGNLTRDENKKVTSIEYNYMGLPSQIVFNDDNNRRIVYRYDGAGIKRQRIIYTRDAGGNALPPITSDYVGGMLYVNNVLQFIPTAEGRWLPAEVLPQSAAAQGAYEYHYTDHLGSLRMALRQIADVPAYTATMETSQAQIEEATFDNVSTTRDVTYYRTGSRSAKVNQQKVLGPWRTVSLVKGDKVAAKAYGFYTGTSTTNRTPLQLFLQAYGSNYPVTGEKTGNNYPRLQIGVSANIAQPTTTLGVPVAYLKWLFYDKDGNLVPSASGIRQITTAATTSWELLSMPATWQAPMDGSLQVFVANESETSVWFDDVEIKYTPDLIAQEVHYDPWGLELVGIGESGNPECKWKFQNKEMEDALALFWQDFGARYYDPQLGRWHSVDPADQFASGYVGMGNNPMNGTDPDGTIFIVDDILIGMAVGAIIGGMMNIGKSDREFVKGVAIGGAMGGLGGFAGAFAPLGVLPGMAYGAGTGAVLGAANAALSGGNIGRGALTGAITGGIMGGISGGIEAMQLGGDFLTGQRPAHEFTQADLDALGISTVGGKKVNYDNKSLREFAKKQFSNGRGYLTMTHRPSNYSVNPSGSWKGPHGDDVLGVTKGSVWGHGQFKANIYISKKAFESESALFLTVGHEYTHAQHDLFGLMVTYKNGDGYFANYVDMSERGALEWTIKAANQNGWYSRQAFYESLILRNQYRFDLPSTFESQMSTLFIK